MQALRKMPDIRELALFDSCVTLSRLSAPGLSGGRAVGPFLALPRLPKPEGQSAPSSFYSS